MRVRCSHVHSWLMYQGHPLMRNISLNSLRSHRFCLQTSTWVSWITSCTDSSAKQTERNPFSGRKRSYTNQSVQRRMKRYCSLITQILNCVDESLSVWQNNALVEKCTSFIFLSCSPGTHLYTSDQITFYGGYNQNFIFPVDMESCIYLVKCGFKKPQLQILFLKQKKIIIY